MEFAMGSCGSKIIQREERVISAPLELVLRLGCRAASPEQIGVSVEPVQAAGPLFQREAHARLWCLKAMDTELMPDVRKPRQSQAPWLLTQRPSVGAMLVPLSSFNRRGIE